MLTWCSLFLRLLAKKSQRDRREKCCLFGHTLIKVETENYEQYLEYIGAGKMTVNKFLLITAGFLPSRYNRSNPGTISKFQDYYRKPEKNHIWKIKITQIGMIMKATRMLTIRLEEDKQWRIRQYLSIYIGNILSILCFENIMSISIGNFMSIFLTIFINISLEYFGNILSISFENILAIFSLARLCQFLLQIFYQI